MLQAALTKMHPAVQQLLQTQAHLAELGCDVPDVTSSCIK